MKQLKCPDCDAGVETMYAGGTAEDVMKVMMPHYMEAHKDVMESATPEKHQAWMASFTTDFDAAPELPVKEIGCYQEDCEVKFSNADHDALLNEMYEHYMKEHPTVIPSAT